MDVTSPVRLSKGVPGAATTAHRADPLGSPPGLLVGAPGLDLAGRELSPGEYRFQIVPLSHTGTTPFVACLF